MLPKKFLEKVIMLQLILFTICAVGSTTSLRLEDTEEGSCEQVYYPPISNVDLDLVDTFKYVPALNRYHLYRSVSGHPQFQTMREFELYYNACLMRNTSFSTGQGMSIGFGGRVLGRYVTRPRRNEPGVIDSVSVGEQSIGMVQTMTLTDHRSFLFVANCWTDSNQRSWAVMSNTPVLSASTIRMIEQHAVSLGFDREEIVFLNYSSCKTNTDDENKRSLIARGSGGRIPSTRNTSSNLQSGAVIGANTRVTSGEGKGRGWRR